MSAQVFQPTPYPQVNALLHELLTGVQRIFGTHLVGMYLDGSLASGDFDRDSDVDFVVVTDDEITDDQFLALRALHEHIAALDVWCATELEGTYLSQAALRRYDPARALHPNIQRDKNARLEWVQHDDDWIVHLDILQRRGLTVVGPAPVSLIDPVSPDALRRAMLKRLNGWARHILDDPAIINGRGYQSYTVLSLCRILYTLEFGTVVSKPVAARWAQETFGARWAPLIERTWASRHNPSQPAASADMSETLNFIRFTLERSVLYHIPTQA